MLFICWGKYFSCISTWFFYGVQSFIECVDVCC